MSIGAQLLKQKVKMIKVKIIAVMLFLRLFSLRFPFRCKIQVLRPRLELPLLKRLQSLKRFRFVAIEKILKLGHIDRVPNLPGMIKKTDRLIAIDDQLNVLHVIAKRLRTLVFFGIDKSLLQRRAVVIEKAGAEKFFEARQRFLEEMAQQHGVVIAGAQQLLHFAETLWLWNNVDIDLIPLYFYPPHNVFFELRALIIKNVEAQRLAVANQNAVAVGFEPTGPAQQLEGFFGFVVVFVDAGRRVTALPGKWADADIRAGGGEKTAFDFLAVNGV